MGLASLMILRAIASLNGQPYKEACTNKAAGDTCEYQSDAGNPDEFYRARDLPGAMIRSACSVHSRQGYLGCFSKKEDAAVFQVRTGLSKGSDRIFKENPAHNTTGHCIAHYSNQQVQCLKAVQFVSSQKLCSETGGDEDGEEWQGKAVGQPCTHSSSANTVCAHHARRGSWMCLAPKEESMVFVICQGQSPGAACSYTSDGTHGTDSGLIQGECHPHEGHGGMMCMGPAHFATTTATFVHSISSESGGISTTAFTLLAVGGVATLVSIALGAGLWLKFGVAKVVMVQEVGPVHRHIASIACVAGQPVDNSNVEKALG